MNKLDLMYPRDGFASSVDYLAEKYPNLVFVTADMTGSARLTEFKNKNPNRCFDVGIAEQSMVSVAAGLAHEGYVVMTYATAPFASMRCYEQIRTDVAYGSLPIIMLANGSGYSNGDSGPTHCGLEDSSLLCACPNMRVLEPSDPHYIGKLLESSIICAKPTYVRLGRRYSYKLYSDDLEITIGKALLLREGNDGAFIAAGAMVYDAFDAAERLEAEEGWSIRVIDMPTIKPIDKAAVISATCTKHIVVVQDGNIFGGLGHLVGATIAEAGLSCKIAYRGCPDTFVPIASPGALYHRNQMDADGLFQTMKQLFQ